MAQTATIYERKGKKGTSYILNYVDPTLGRQRVTLRNATTRREAEVIRLEKEYELRTGRVITADQLILFNFADEYLKWYSLEYPTSYYRIKQIIEDHLLPFFGNLPIDFIKRKKCEDYKHMRVKAGVRRATINKELQTLKAMINRALEWEYIDANPIQRLRMLPELDSKPPEYYTQEQLQALFSKANRPHWWQFIANTGLRRGEAQILQTTWIGRDEMKILSTETSRTKSAKWRVLPLPENAQAAREQFTPDGKFLFERMNPRSFTRAFAREAKRAGLPGSVHWLRHSYISHLVMSGAHIRAVQQLAGHGNVKTTEKYIHLSPGFVRDGVMINL